MAVVSNKFILLLTIFLLFSCTSHAQQSEFDVYQLSLANFTKDKSRLEQVIENCNKNRKTVKRSVLEPLNLSTAELKVALFVLNERATARCENGLRERLFYSAAVHRQVSQYYQKDPGDAAGYKESIMLIAERGKLDFEIKYSSIDESLKTSLENIAELKTPFLVLETLEQF